jgi:hypothetical protein
MLSLATVPWAGNLIAADLSGPGSSWAGWLYAGIPVIAVLVGFLLWTGRQTHRGT